MTAAPESASGPAGWHFDNSYARLPAAFHSRVRPTPVSEPRLLLLNAPLARELGLDPGVLSAPDAEPWFTGNTLPAGADPIAQAYAGHQFGNFTRLGDGRAILLGEQITPDGRRADIQLKGPGPTPYSRRGDGRAALGPMLREYLVSEAMHALGIPTTRSLAVAVTGEPVFREQPLRGAVLTRVAASHIRVGTFEYFAALGDPGALRVLVEHTVARHLPDRAPDANPAAALLADAVERQASLVAHWLRVGFVHGVMNTDNVALSGETIDYGPCAFLDAYDPGAVFSSIDHQGRYAFGNQPQIAAWNLARLAEALLPVLGDPPEAALETAREITGRFPVRFREHWHAQLRSKLGLSTEEPEDTALGEELLRWMHRTRADYTATFRGLGRALTGPVDPGVDPEIVAWHGRWRERVGREPGFPTAVADRMRRANPAVIPRNHVVEAALEAAAGPGDLTAFHRVLKAVQSPYDAAGQPDELLNPPPPGTPRCRTFCGT